jgi:hypothetical protein
VLDGDTQADEPSGSPARVKDSTHKRVIDRVRRGRRSGAKISKTLIVLGTTKGPPASAQRAAA